MVTTINDRDHDDNDDGGDEDDDDGDDDDEDENDGVDDDYGHNDGDGFPDGNDNAEGDGDGCVVGDSDDGAGTSPCTPWFGRVVVVVTMPSTRSPATCGGWHGHHSSTARLTSLTGNNKVR